MKRLVLAALLAAVPAASQAAIFVVRHAERVSLKDDASLLSRAGKRRAESLRRALASLKLKAVYCTEYQRTQQTAEPAAKAHSLTPVVISTEDPKALLEALRKLAPDDDALVVGHTDTIPDLLKALGVERPISIGPLDYDNLFMVSPREGHPPAFHRLHYSSK